MEEYGLVKIRVENSRSRSGKHAFRAIAVIVNDGKLELVDVDRVPGTLVKPRYVKGVAKIANLKLPKDSYVVLLELVKNPRNKVKGVVRVLDSDGNEKLRLKYINGVVRRSRGASELGSIALKALEFLRIPYHRVNLRTGVNT